MAKKTQKTAQNTAIVGGIIGAVAAATAGAYFLYGTKQGKHARKEIKGWTVRAKGEILEKIEGLKDVNEEAYHQVVDSVLKRYQSLKHIDSRELVQISREIKDHWKNIQKEIEQGKKKVAKVKASIGNIAKNVKKEVVSGKPKAKAKVKVVRSKKDE